MSRKLHEAGIQKKEKFEESLTAPQALIDAARRRDAELRAMRTKAHANGHKILPHENPEVLESNNVVVDFPDVQPAPAEVLADEFVVQHDVQEVVAEVDLPLGSTVENSVNGNLLYLPSVGSHPKYRQPATFGPRRKEKRSGSRKDRRLTARRKQADAVGLAFSSIEKNSKEVSRGIAVMMQPDGMKGTAQASQKDPTAQRRVKSKASWDAQFRSDKIATGHPALWAELGVSGGLIEIFDRYRYAAKNDSESPSERRQRLKDMGEARSQGKVQYSPETGVDLPTLFTRLSSGENPSATPARKK